MMVIEFLETNIITALVKNDEKVWTKLDEKIFRGEEVFISGMNYYKIKRGLLAVNAAKKLNSFDRFCKKFGILFLDDQEIFDTASEIYADLKRKGRLISDADILIAPLAITRDNSCF